jgi:hypothetical protein
MLLSIPLLLEAACGGDSPMGPSDVGQALAPGATPPRPAATATPTAPAKPGVPALVLYDPRDRAALPPGVERQPTLAPEVEKRVLSVLSPSYKTKREECAGTQDVFYRVTASAPGAFTAPAAKEIAYIVQGESCEAPGAQPVEATHLLIFDGDKNVAQAGGKAPAGAGKPAGFAGVEIRARPDLDQDGVREILVTSSGAAGEEARVYSAKAGAVKLIKEFTGVYVDGCHGGSKPQVQAQVLHYTPGAAGAPPQFTTEAFTAECPASGDVKLADFKAVAAPAAASPAPASPASPAPALPESPAPAPASPESAQPSAQP